MSHEDKWYEFLVEAELTLFPSAISGRMSGITSGYRPNHNFADESNRDMRIGVVTVPNGEWINPGETKIVMIQFIMPEGYVVDLKPGLTWRIQEGGNHVGNGKVLFVIDPDKSES